MNQDFDINAFLDELVSAVNQLDRWKINQLLKTYPSRTINAVVRHADNLVISSKAEHDDGIRLSKASLMAAIDELRKSAGE